LAGGLAPQSNSILEILESVPLESTSISTNYPCAPSYTQIWVVQHELAMVPSRQRPRCILQPACNAVAYPSDRL
jgi:hypothetical protein